jgi:hypothetical protein
MQRQTGFDSPTRSAFRLYLRTGRKSRADSAPELKFNPYHDPRNGQFTFAPGGPRSFNDIVVSPRGYAPAAPGGPVGRGGAGQRRSNYEAYYGPMTLHRVFTSWRSAVGGAILAPADGFFSPTGPANDLTTDLAMRAANVVIAQTKKVDPNYIVYDAFPSTFEGQMNHLNNLRVDRAAAFYRVRGDPRPLQVETFRFLQRRVDAAYAAGIKALREGRLKGRLSEQEALGNFIDITVRRELRELYNFPQIISNPRHPVRVVGREYQTGETDRTYTIPDSRVGNVAFDATLARKTPGMKQIRGFFASDFKPDMVIIVRPTQAGGSYAITRPRR